MVKYWIRPNKKENITDRKWDTKNTEKIQPGDRVILYVSGIKKLAGILDLGEDGQFQFIIKINEDNWVDMPSDDFLKNLDYVKERDYDYSTGNWKGLIVQSTYEISKDDYNKLKSYIMENID